MSRQPPSDAACAKAWDRIVELAREHALVVQAAGGAMTLATPEAQREHGIRARVLRTHRMDASGEQEELPL